MITILRKKIVVIIISLIFIASIVFFSYLFLPKKNQIRQSFFEVHMESTTATDYMFNQLNELVNLTDKYEIKTTLLFTPQWVEIILKDKQKIDLVQQWKNKGHEIGGHHHALSGKTKCVWDGYTNLNVAKSNILKIKNECVSEVKAPPFVEYWNRLFADLEKNGKPKDMTEYMAVLRQLGDIETITMSGADKDWPDGPTCQGGGIKPASAISIPKKILLNNHTVTILEAAALLEDTNIDDALNLEELKKEYLSDNEGIIGVVIHPEDFQKNPDLYKQWLEFLKSQKTDSKTINELCN